MFTPRIDFQRLRRSPLLQRLTLVVMLAVALPVNVYRASGQALNSGVLAIESDTAGSLVIDGSVKAQLSPTKVVQITLAAGQHIVELRAADNRSLWKEVVSVPAREQVVRQVMLRGSNQANAPASSPSSFKNPLEAAAYDELCILGRAKEAKAIAGGDFPRCTISESVITTAEAELSECPEGVWKDLNDQLKRAIKNGDADQSKKANDAIIAKGCFEGRFASNLYTLGRHLEALRYANLQVDAAGDHRQPNVFSFPPNSTVSRGNSQSWGIRAGIKHALRDDGGALDDLAQADGWYDLAVSQRHKEAPDLEFGPLDDKHKAFSRIQRAIFLRGLGRLSEARDALYEAANLNVIPERSFAEVVMAWIQADLSRLPPRSTDRSSVTDQIEEVSRTGRYSTLPQAQTLASGASATTPPTLVVENQTGHELTVLLDGPASKSLSVKAGATSAPIELPSGSYRILGRVSSSQVLPFLGSQQYAAGATYKLAFSVGQ